MKDITGQPLSKEAVERALETVRACMVRDILKLPPLLAVELLTIKLALEELLKTK